MSFFTCGANHIAVDTIKRAEDSDHWIVRCYEYAGQRGEAEFVTHFPIAEVEDVNLLECEEQPLEHIKNSFAAHFKPYEIKTFRFRLA